MFIIVVVLAIAAVVGTVAALNWDEILIALKGKKLAVLGARTTGKTHLIKFLTDGSIPEEYRQTSESESTEGRRFKLKDLELTIKKSKDVPGPRNFDWEKIVTGTEKENGADIVLYLLRVDWIMKGDKRHEARVKKDIGQIKRWLNASPKEFPLFIIGTGCDLTDKDLTALPEDQIGEYMDEISCMPFFRDIVLRGGGEKKVKLILGSLKSKPTTEVLVYALFNQIQET